MGARRAFSAIRLVCLVRAAATLACATAALACAAAVVVSCNGTTGYDLVSFRAAAVGPADAVAGQPYSFGPTDRGYTITLRAAVMHVGALYLDQSVPTSGGGASPCTLPGTYVGEVRGIGGDGGAGGRDVDLLSPQLQYFAGGGEGSTLPAAAAEVWLTHGDVFASSDPLPDLTLDGVASKPGTTPIHFQASVTIDDRRYAAPPNSALPGENPICLARIVTPILVDVTLAQGGTLVLHLDPTKLFANVDFSRLPDPTADPALFTNDTSNQPSVNLYDNLRAAGPVYGFEWRPATP